MFWQPPLKEGEDVDPEKVKFLPLGFDEFYGRKVIDKENSSKHSVSWLKNGLKSRLDSLQKWAEERKKDSELEKELIEKELEMIETEIFMEETIEDMEEELKWIEKEEDKKMMGLLGKDSTSSTNLETKASVEEEGEEENNYDYDDDEDADDAPPSSFGSIAAYQDPSKDQKPNKPRDSSFSTASLHFASSTPVSGVSSFFMCTFNERSLQS